MKELLNNEVDPHNIPISDIILSYTQDDGYESQRNFLLETYGNSKVGEDYIIIEGSHCSCYDFDDTYWEFTAYNHDELIKIAKSRAEDSSYWNPTFWKMVLKYLDEEL